MADRGEWWVCGKCRDRYYKLGFGKQHKGYCEQNE
jgi:hypothetical protein